MLLQCYKKKFSQAKSLFKTGRSGTSDPEGILGEKLSAKERMLILEHALPRPKRPNGLRMFTSSDEFKRKQLGQMVAERMEQIRKEDGDPEKRFTQNDQFEIMEKIKVEEWNKLNNSSKEIYRKMAKDAAVAGIGNVPNDLSEYVLRLLLARMKLKCYTSDDAVANFFRVTKVVNAQLAACGNVQRLMFTNYVIGDALYYSV